MLAQCDPLCGEGFHGFNWTVLVDGEVDVFYDYYIEKFSTVLAEPEGGGPVDAR